MPAAISAAAMILKRCGCFMTFSKRTSEFHYMGRILPAFLAAGNALPHTLLLELAVFCDFGYS